MRVEEQEAHFQRWLRDHLGVVRKVVRAYAATQHDQDDLFQDVLVNLWSSIPNFRGESRETTWIYRVAFNTALIWQRSERRRMQHHAAFLDAARMTAPTNPQSGSHDELIERLYDAIRQLPKIDASLALMHLDGLSYQEMSEVLGISENYVGVKLTRIRQHLTERLQGESNELR